MTLEEFLRIVHTVADDINQFKAWMADNSIDPNQDRSADDWWKLWAKYVASLYKGK